MVKIRGSYPDVPPCRGDRAFPFVYRAIETRVAGQTSYELLDRAGADRSALPNPPADALRHYAERYGPFHACKRPDPVLRDQEALYLQFSEPLTRGGRPAPYPGAVPRCPRGTPVRRALTARDGDVLFSVHRAALSPSFLIDPPPNAIARLQGAANRFGATGLCQAPLPGGRGTGLFWALHKNPLDALSQAALLDASRSSETPPRDPAEFLPRAMQPCLAQASQRGALEARIRAFAPEVEWLEESGFDPFARRLQATRAVGRMEAFSPAPVDELYDKLLERAGALAFQYGAEEPELVAIAADVGRHAEDAPQFVMGICLILALRIARELFWRHREEAGLLADIDAIAETIERGIRQGLIRLRMKGLRDVILEPVTLAEYDQRKDTMTLHPDEALPSLRFLFELFVHESYHAHRDRLAEKRERTQEEMGAYQRGYRASRLLHRAIAAVAGERVFDVLDEIRRFWRERLSLPALALHCMGLPKQFTERSEEEGRIKKQLFDQWRLEVQEWRGAALSEMHTSLFEDYSRLSEIHDDELMSLLRHFTRVGLRYDAGELGPRRLSMREIDAHLAADRKAMALSAEEPDFLARWAQHLLSKYGEYLALASYLRPQLIKPLLDRYAGDREAIAKALPHDDIPNDGIPGLAR